MPSLAAFVKGKRKREQWGRGKKRTRAPSPILLGNNVRKSLWTTQTFYRNETSSCISDRAPIDSVFDAISPRGQNMHHSTQVIAEAKDLSPPEISIRSAKWKGALNNHALFYWVSVQSTNNERPVCRPGPQLTITQQKVGVSSTKIPPSPPHVLPSRVTHSFFPLTHRRALVSSIRSSVAHRFKFPSLLSWNFNGDKKGEPAG